METKEISRAIIERLPRYYRYLGELKDSGIERISSKELSALMHVTASQIRQDLNHFGGFGQQGYGYNVSTLYDEIANILGLHRKHNLIMIGAGHLGQALANYVNFERRGFVIKGIFDINKEIHGQTIRGIRIRPMEEIADFMKEQEVDIAVLTIPKAEAVKVSKQLIDHGIRAIWNFAHVDLDVPDNVVVENVHLSESLMRLSYNLANVSGQE
ncbi:MAG: redox-sensing transcriptional repressor Rex [Lachnospiraceae bacterium]|nr:redox-sensing transcriptional repressor Rex [Lachnospiraceae bacterium]